MRKWLAAMAVGLVGLVGCGGDSDDQAPVAAVEREEEVVRIEARAHDFGFELSSDTIPVGPIETVLINEGEQPHHALIYRLNDGVELADFEEQVMADDSAVPRLSRGGTNGISEVIGPGEETLSTGDSLEPGQYVFMCFVRDQSMKTSDTHAELGMIAGFTVE